MALDAIVFYVNKAKWRGWSSKKLPTSSIWDADRRTRTRTEAEVFRRIESFLSNGSDRLTDDKWCGRGAEGGREEKEGGFRPIGATSTVCKAIPAGNADVGAPFPLFDALLSLLENWFVLALLPC